MSNPAPDQPAPSEKEDSGSSLMQQMLEATLLRRERSLTEQEWQVLRRVATEAHNSGHGMVEFVEALMWELCGLRFPQIQSDVETCKRLCKRVANTLAADPYGRQRLVEFQQHLLHPQS